MPLQYAPHELVRLLKCVTLVSYISYYKWSENNKMHYCQYFQLSEYVIRKVQANQVEVKLNGTRQLLVYIDGDNIKQYCKEKHVRFVSH